MARLSYDDDSGPHEVLLSGGRMVVGRAPDAHVVVDDATVSRRHAALEANGSGWEVVDLDSRNGVLVNGRRVQRVELAGGDELTLGQCVLRYADDAPSSAPSPGVGDVPGTLVRPVQATGSFDALGLGAPAAVDEQGGGSVVLSPGELRRIEADHRVLRTLVEVGQTLLTVQPLDQVLETVLDVIFKYVPADRCYLMLHDASRGRLVPEVTRTRFGDVAQPADISHTIAERAMRDRVSILTQDAQSDPRFSGGESIIALGIRSAMCAPLWKQDDVIGTVYVDTAAQRHVFTAADLDLLTALSHFAAIAIERARLLRRIQEEERARQRLSRYHSPAVVEQILHSAGAGQTTGGELEVEEREVSVLFADIAGFTGLTESMPPRDVASMLNRFFARMADVVFRHGGTLDKYIGDEIMAVFGAPFEQPDHALRAVRAGMEMLALQEPVGPRDSDRTRVLRLKVAVNSGRVVAGDIGSPQRVEYTVLGGTVNTAARLEGHARPGQLLVGPETRAAIGELVPTRLVGEIELRGLSLPVRVYEVVREASRESARRGEEG